MILDRILAKKREEVHRLHSQYDPAWLRERAEACPPARDIIGALRGCPHTPIIAEIKRASPSAGTLKATVSVEGLARAYEDGGACALSVLTDGPFFNGSLEDLMKARGTVGLPVLRKDFIIDPVQLYESRVSGADSVLLIAAALSRERLHGLYEGALALGMTPLVEVHDEAELKGVLDLNPIMVGINNRNLSTLEVSLETCVRLRPRVPPEVLVVGESGINDPADVASLMDAGMDAFLIGTSLMCSSDPAALLRTFCAAGRG